MYNFKCCFHLFLGILYFLPSVQLLAQEKYEPTLLKNSQIYLNSSENDLSRMIVNKLTINRDWEETTNQFLNEYFSSLEGTSNDVSQVNKDKIKKIFLKKFPEFYKECFAKSILILLEDKELLFFFYANQNNWYISEKDNEYFTKKYSNKLNRFDEDLSDTFRSIYRNESKNFFSEIITPLETKNITPKKNNNTLIYILLFLFIGVIIYYLKFT